MLTELDCKTIDLIQSEYQNSEYPWSIGYSGGKDSTALLKLTILALLKSKKRKKRINVVYCDTGVEIPLMAALVDNTFRKLQKESFDCDLPFNCVKISPQLKDRFFVKVIGRGYPTPTNAFRWCTDRLRVIPIQSFLRNHSKENIVLLGVRKGESYERDRVILKQYLEKIYYFRQRSFNRVKIFSPILNYNETNVWEIILNGTFPQSIDGDKLRKYYTLVKNDRDGTLGGRFGCWTCTVVRKDKATLNLIDAGYVDLIPLLRFRNWIISARENPDYRCKRRRNGERGMGPFTLEARALILEKLLMAQNESGHKLISEDELDYIEKLWLVDKYSKRYREY